jgi:Zn ribbon nucleic-acid-binding protein
MSANHYSDERQRRLLATIRCPACQEQNRPNQKEMLELDAKGQAYCNKCGHSWIADPPWTPR